MPPVPMAARRVPAITGMPPVDPHASMCVGAALYRACACRCNPIVSFRASLQRSEPDRTGSRLQVRLLDARVGTNGGASPRGCEGGTHHTCAISWLVPHASVQVSGDEQGLAPALAPATSAPKPISFPNMSVVNCGATR